MTRESRTSITDLRSLLEQKQVKAGLEKHQPAHLLRYRLSSSSLSCGIPMGAITEISGSAKLEWLMQFLLEHQELRVFWIEQQFLLNPQALLQRGLTPDRFIFAECFQDLFACCRKALQSQMFQCIVAPHVFDDPSSLKALQLFSEKFNVMLVLLAEHSSRQAWPLTLQFAVNRLGASEGLAIDLQKNKGGGVILTCLLPAAT